MASSEPHKNHRFVVLDGLRGVAAIMVVINHTTNNSAVMAGLAVPFFFMLSGFVLAYASAEKMQTRGQQKRFAIGRLIRLYPLYLAGTAIALIPAAALVYQHYDFWTPTAYVEALAAAPFFIPLNYDSYFPFDIPAWTLTFELIVNAVFLFTGWRWLPTILIAAISAPLMLWDPSDTFVNDLAVELPVAFFCFFLGVVMCRVWCAGWLPKFGLHPLLLVLILAGLYWVNPTHQLRYGAVVVVVIHPLIVWIAASTTAKGVTARLMAWLGMVSYGVYMLHVPIAMWFEGSESLVAKYSPKAASDIDRLMVFMVVPLALAAAHYLTTRFETPLRKKLWAKFQTSSAIVRGGAAL